MEMPNNYLEELSLKGENKELFTTIITNLRISNFTNQHRKDTHATYDEVWNLMQDRKKQLIKNFGLITEIKQITELERRKNILQGLVQLYNNSWQVRKLQKEKFNYSFSDNELMLNRIDKISHDGRDYQGIKITKFFTKLFKSVGYVGSQKEIGLFNNERTDDIIYMTPSPVAILIASEVGHSCLSDGGINDHMGSVYAALSNTMVVANKDFSWRAWVFVNEERKEFKVMKGYPRENMGNYHSVVEYMKSLGYTYSNGEYYFKDDIMYHADAEPFYAIPQGVPKDYEMKSFDLTEPTDFCVVTGRRTLTSDMSSVYYCEDCCVHHEAGDEYIIKDGDALCPSCFDDVAIECQAVNDWIPYYDTQAFSIDVDYDQESGRRCKYHCSECPFVDRD